jgi:hypothetical protein
MALEVPVGKRTAAFDGVAAPGFPVLASLLMSSDAKCSSAAANF